MSKKNLGKLLILLVVSIIVAIGIYCRITRLIEPGLADLSDGMLAEAESLIVTETDLESYIDKKPEKFRELAKKDIEGTLDELIQRKLLLLEAEKLPKEALPDIEGMSEAKAQTALLNALKKHVTKDITALEQDIKTYYEEHRHEYEGRDGGSYEEMHDSIEKYIVYQKSSKLFKKYVDNLLEIAGILKNRDWVMEVRAQFKDPLEEAKKSGKVVLADFGRGI